MMKRIIALLLALILTVGLLPTVALAAEGDAGAATAPADVIDGYYDDNNEWTKGKLSAVYSPRRAGCLQDRETDLEP